MTASKSGISYSVGVNGTRVTRRANGKVQRLPLRMNPSGPYGNAAGIGVDETRLRDQVNGASSPWSCSSRTRASMASVIALSAPGAGRDHRHQPGVVGPSALGDDKGWQQQALRLLYTL